MLDFVNHFKDKPWPKEVAQVILGPSKVAQIDHAVATLIEGHAPPDRSIARQVENWLEVLKASVATDAIDVSRFDAYKRHIGIFRNWIGGDQPLESITARKTGGMVDLPCPEGERQGVQPCLREDHFHDDKAVHQPLG